MAMTAAISGVGPMVCTAAGADAGGVFTVSIGAGAVGVADAAAGGGAAACVAIVSVCTPSWMTAENAAGATAVYATTSGTPSPWRITLSAWGISVRPDNE